MKTALVYHKKYLEHNPGSFHPERRERLIKTMDYFKEKGVLGKVDLLTPSPASKEELLRVHREEHVERIREISRKGGGMLDPDTKAQENTYDIAKLAAGGVMLAGKVVMEGKAKNSFALVRPPGHHASSNRAMGFCYFNNVAIAIRYLQKNFSLKRVFLLDWDVHAFNGTSEIFYSDPEVLNVSLHQDPRSFYPGTGFISEVGEGEGEGYTVNIPLPAGSGDADYSYIMGQFILPLIDSFRPELMVISAGQDAHRDDPISGIDLTKEGYGKMTEMLVKKAEKHCQGKIFAELEGGYNLESLKKSNYEIMRGLLGEKSSERVRGKILDSSRGMAKKLREIFKKYHSI